MPDCRIPGPVSAVQCVNGSLDRGRPIGVVRDRPAPVRGPRLFLGRVERVSAEESDAYFAGRPLNNRLGAWASSQSGPLESAQALEARVEEFRQRFAGGEIPRPSHWGGYRLIPDRMEFWQGRPSRLHDRFVYVIDGQGNWTVGRINP